MTDREVVYDIVYDVFEDGEKADIAFHRALEETSDEISIKLVKRLTYGVIERAITIDALIDKYSKIPFRKLDSDVRILLEMGIYEICYMDSIPDYATVNEIVGLASAKHKKDYINAVLHAVINDKNNNIDLTNGFTWAQKLSLPDELWDVLVASYGAKTAKRIGEAFLSRSGEICLHIDTARISIDEYMDMLGSAGIDCEIGRYFDDAVIVKGSPDVTGLLGYSQGYFYVMDEASMLPVCVSGIRPGDTVVDVCAAPGGKTVHAMMRMRGEGVISARDISKQKVNRIKDNISRYPYDNVSVKIHDATKPDEEWSDRADVLLLDVPCTGIGIIGRKPDLKYGAINRALDIDKLQQEIVRQSLPMLREGGVLIYSTCTLNPDENEAMAEWIETELGLVPESLDEYLPEALRSRQTATGRLTVIPGIHQMDGFFVSRFRKKSN